MKIVIDIDNETYARIQALVNADYFEHDICGYSMQRIANGTPYKERLHGRWIIIDDTERFIAKCSVCGTIEDSRMIKDYPCCNCCGAEMEAIN